MDFFGAKTAMLNKNIWNIQLPHTTHTSDKFTKLKQDVFKRTILRKVYRSVYLSTPSYRCKTTSFFKALLKLQQLRNSRVTCQKIADTRVSRLNIYREAVEIYINNPQCKLTAGSFAGYSFINCSECRKMADNLKEGL